MTLWSDYVQKTIMSASPSDLVGKGGTHPRPPQPHPPPPPHPPPLMSKRRGSASVGCKSHQLPSCSWQVHQGGQQSVCAKQGSFSRAIQLHLQM